MNGWHRLHPLSPAVRAGRALIAIGFIFLPTLVSGGTNGWDVAWHVIAVAVLIVLGFISWVVTRWRIDGNDLRIETGLVRRSSQRYPLSQVQAIDTVRPGHRAGARPRRAAPAHGRHRRRGAARVPAGAAGEHGAGALARVVAGRARGDARADGSRARARAARSRRRIDRLQRADDRARRLRRSLSASRSRQGGAAWLARRCRS